MTEIKMLTLKLEDDEPVTLNASTTREEVVACLSDALQNRRDAYLRLKHYRQDTIKSLIDANPKFPEWKCKVKVEASKEWLRRRKDFDEAEHDVEILRTMLETNRVHFEGGMI